MLFDPVLDNGPGGYGYDRVKKHYKEFSPYYNIKEGLPPTIIFLGTNDNLIPVETMEKYRDNMLELGNVCDLYLYEDLNMVLIMVEIIMFIIMILLNKMESF